MNPHSANIIVFWTIESILGWQKLTLRLIMNTKFVLCRADCADTGKALGQRRSLGCTEESYFVLT